MVLVIIVGRFWSWKESLSHLIAQKFRVIFEVGSDIMEKKFCLNRNSWTFNTLVVYAERNCQDEQTFLKRIAKTVMYERSEIMMRTQTIIVKNVLWALSYKKCSRSLRQLLVKWKWGFWPFLSSPWHNISTERKRNTVCMEKSLGGRVTSQEFIETEIETNRRDVIDS